MQPLYASISVNEVAFFLLICLLMVLGSLFWLARRYRQSEQTRHSLQLALADALHEQTQVERLLHAVWLSATSSIFLVDEWGQLVWASKSARSLMSAPDASLPAPLHQVIGVHALVSMSERVFRDFQEHGRQFHLGDQVFWVRAIPIEGEPLLVALIVEDVTELQRLGRARRDFVANISHDLRTPIATIQLLVETLQLGAIDKPKKRRKLLNSIADQTLTLHQLAQELMDLSMIESGRLPLRLVPTPLESIIEPAITRFETQIEHKAIRIHRKFDADIMVLADPENMQRVLQNLLHNAIKFTPPGGNIEIGARMDAEEVLISIADSGPGIPHEHLDRIFERFYKTDPSRGDGGSGLGLAIARHIVEGHGGRIWAESEPGRGATFYFTLLRG